MVTDAGFRYEVRKDFYSKMSETPERRNSSIKMSEIRTSEFNRLRAGGFRQECRKGHTVGLGA